MKHLHEKNEQYAEPSKDILDTFPNPGSTEVELIQKEFTSLCPLTQQPDYATIKILYSPNRLCIESKSLKLYLSAFRNFKGFAETITERICKDLFEVLQPTWIGVTGEFTSRGGISINAASEKREEGR